MNKTYKRLHYRMTADLYEIELNESPRLIIGWCKGAEKFLSVELPGAF